MASIFRRLRAALRRSAASAPPGLDGLRIRPMTHRDLAAVTAIESASFGSPWRASTYSRAVGDSNQYFYVARLGGRVVGYAGFWVEGDRAHIAKLAVDPGQLRQGIGSALLEFLLDQIRRVGLGRAYLEVRQGNLAAQRLYQRFGFRFVRVQPRAYPNNSEDAFVLVRDDLLEASPPP